MQLDLLTRVTELVDEMREDELFALRLALDAVRQSVERKLPKVIKVVLDAHAEDHILDEFATIELPNAVFKVAIDENMFRRVVRLQLGQLRVLLENPQLGIILEDGREESTLERNNCLLLQTSIVFLADFK